MTRKRRAADLCLVCDKPWGECECKVPPDLEEQRDAAHGDLGLPPSSVVQAAP